MASEYPVPTTEELDAMFDGCRTGAVGGATTSAGRSTS